MTVIVYRDGTMAADSGAFLGGAKRSYNNKIARAPDGTLYGATGNASDGTTYLTWVREGCVGSEPNIRRTKESDSEDALHILRVRPGSDPEVITGYGIFVWEEAPYAAIGAAHEVALGALYAGASAEKAVLASIEHSQWAHGPVRCISHEGSLGDFQRKVEIVNFLRGGK